MRIPAPLPAVSLAAFEKTSDDDVVLFVFPTCSNSGENAKHRKVPREEVVREKLIVNCWEWEERESGCACVIIT